MSKRKKRLTDYVIMGAADFEARTPWRRAPMSFDEWMRTGLETPEQLAYWAGWDASANDCYARAQRKAAVTR